MHFLRWKLLGEFPDGGKRIRKRRRKAQIDAGVEREEEVDDEIEGKKEPMR